jgi:hypothetical protein
MPAQNATPSLLPAGNRCGPPEEERFGSQRHPCALTVPFYDTARTANNQIYIPPTVTPEVARERNHGVSLVSFTVTPSAVFTKYVGPEMDLKALAVGSGCGCGVDNLTVSPTAVAPYEFAEAGGGILGRCLGKRVAAFPVEVAAAFGGDPPMAAGAGGERVPNPGAGLC